MILIRTGSTDIYENLAAEYYLATEKKLEDTVFMLWQSGTPTIVCGRYQNVFQEVNMSYVEDKHYKIARRLSGGGTVYQDDRVFQYAYIAPKTTDGIDFATWLAPVVEAMQRMGIPVEYSSRNDLMIEGHKVSGTAQYHAGEYMVHHGTILYDTDLEELERCLKVAAEKIESKGIRSVRERVVNLSHYTGHKPVGDFMEALGREILGTEVTEYVLDEHDYERIYEIAENRFRNWDWIYGKSPKSDLVRAKRFEGGRLEAHFSLEKGRICRLELKGDFFAGKDPKVLADALKGCRYEKNDLQKCLTDIGAESFFYQISRKDLLELLF